MNDDSPLAPIGRKVRGLLFVLAAAVPLYVATLLAELRAPMNVQGFGWIAVQIVGYGLAWHFLSGHARRIVIGVQLAAHWVLVIWIFYATAGIS